MFLLTPWDTSSLAWILVDHHLIYSTDGSYSTWGLLCCCAVKLVIRHVPGSSEPMTGTSAHRKPLSTLGICLAVVMKRSFGINLSSSGGSESSYYHVVSMRAWHSSLHLIVSGLYRYERISGGRLVVKRQASSFHDATIATAQTALLFIETQLLNGLTSRALTTALSREREIPISWAAIVIRPAIDINPPRYLSYILLDSRPRLS